MESDKEISEKAADIAISETHRLMNEVGLTRPFYLNKLLQLCECTKPIAATIVKKPGKSKGAKDADSTTTDFIEVPDNTVQLNAVKTVIALYGDEAPAKTTVNIHGEISALLQEIDGATTGPPALRNRVMNSPKQAKKG